MRRLAILLVLATLLAGCTTGGTKVTSQWRDPDLVRLTPKRVLVLARIPEPGTRRMLEDATAEQLQKKGIPAVAAYKALPEMNENDQSFRTLAGDAGADAVVLYTPGKNYTGVANAPGLGTGVGIGPVGVGVGPLIGGSKAEQRMTVDAQFFPAGAPQPVWSTQYDVNLADGIQDGMRDVPGRVVTQLKSDRVL